MVEREGVLQAVGGDMPMGLEPADVVDQDVQPRVGVKHLSSQTAHPGLDGHVRGKASTAGLPSPARMAAAAALVRA